MDSPSISGPENVVDQKRESQCTDKPSKTTNPLPGLYEDGILDPIYQEKTKILNRAIEEIGMGRYQYLLFVVAGFGWFADSVWTLITSLILAPVVAEFHFNGPFLTLAANIGFLVGAISWGLASDIWGRRWPFNATLFIAGVFGLAAGGSQNLVTLASLIAVLGIGVGGNLPVDATIFLDFVPASHQYLLAVVAVFWSFGQFFLSLVAWPLIAKFSCPITATTCHKSENMGWRYLIFTLGGLTVLLWIIRLFTFNLSESPRFLIGVGKDEEAVAVIHKIAAYNSKTTSLTLDELTRAGNISVDKGPDKGSRGILSHTSAFTTKHVKALFATPKMAYSTSLLILLWCIVGLATTLYDSFLPFLLASRGAHFGDASLFITYRNQMILSFIGLPAAFCAGWAVEITWIGRRGTIAISSGLTGAFLFASTTARSSNALLGWNCGYILNSSIMYVVLHTISSEIFPAKDRGTGNGLVWTATRISGVIAPIIALYANITTTVPVYIAGGLVLSVGCLALLLPYETRGKASM
ncbi:hypothetical protein K443DRAFT_678188 [Laccaria amethystina LaAM-08-1]|uniref:Major facilitator superfamily (MFS) profile domain-containing protein n=1 Tax=Laccaria amethystina LaAM-08-1 TaxID=1095629 RepID=A0A0C9X9G0_9AGAR|nr:hypothetical protein K443DRAFT_678188 [Laccaria amethystina LaAM-08-1]